MLGSDATQSVAALRGQVVVLNFWASWCIPCRTEAPILERAHKRLTASGTGTVLGVTYNDSTPASAKFADEYGMSFPSVRDVGTKLAERYGTNRVPETFVIDRRGRIVDVFRGQIDQAFIDRALAKAQVMRRALALALAPACSPCSAGGRRSRSPRRRRSTSSTSRTRSCASTAGSR